MDQTILPEPFSPTVVPNTEVPSNLVNKPLIFLVLALVLQIIVFWSGSSFMYSIFAPEPLILLHALFLVASLIHSRKVLLSIIGPSYLLALTIFILLGFAGNRIGLGALGFVVLIEGLVLIGTFFLISFVFNHLILNFLSTFLRIGILILALAALVLFSVFNLFDHIYIGNPNNGAMAALSQQDLDSILSKNIEMVSQLSVPTSSLEDLVRNNCNAQFFSHAKEIDCIRSSSYLLGGNMAQSHKAQVSSMVTNSGDASKCTSLLTGDADVYDCVFKNIKNVSDCDVLGDANNGLYGRSDCIYRYAEQKKDASLCTSLDTKRDALGYSAQDRCVLNVKNWGPLPSIIIKEIPKTMEQYPICKEYYRVLTCGIENTKDAANRTSYYNSYESIINYIEHPEQYSSKQYSSMGSLENVCRSNYEVDIKGQIGQMYGYDKDLQAIGCIK
ncbi:MAG: hypothetical protein WCV82_02555 [Candidatus Paceibacterota bacterium]